jgi:hypothetical protein
MANQVRQSSVVSLMHGGHHSSADAYLGIGDIHQEPEDTQQQVKAYGNPDRQLVLRQAPLHARVALGKEKDRKPIDPPPVIQLLDKRTDGRSGLYDSPYLFMSSSLVPEEYDEQTKSPELPSNYLTGSLASSIHRLRDTINTEGGFFVFGDLSVKQEGRFRLRFTLYERDDEADEPSFNFVSELVTNVFTVYSSKNFPGMTESTFLTRTFSDQGVKLRLRKDTRALTTRKRSRQAGDSPEAFLERRPKRVSYDRGPTIGNYGQQSMNPMDHMTASAGLGTTQPYVGAGQSMTSMNPGTVLPLPTSGYYMHNFANPPYY